MTKPSDSGPRRAASAKARGSPKGVSAPDDRFFRYIVDGMRNGVIAIRRDGTIGLMNDEACRIFGLVRRADDIGKPYADVLRERPDASRALAGAFVLNQLPNRAEFRLKDLNRVIGYTLSQVRDDRGETVGAAMFFTDLTQVEQREEHERLQDRLASLGEMAAGIAHELKNPLAGIQVMVGLLRRQVPDSKDAQSLLADIISEAKLANAIVVNMLEFVRPLRLHVQQTRLSDVLHQAGALAETMATRGEVVLTISLPADLPPIDGDYHQLCQVFTNLLTNAFEAMGGRGAIDITASLAPAHVDLRFGRGDSEPPRPTVVVDVSDNGPGIPADLTDRIFNPFFTTKPEGSGLGLAIVKKIIDAHEGRIDLSSSDTGTRFRITLPTTSSTAWFTQRKD